MNFLGHLFLTPDDDGLLVGNFIADSVKGDPYRQCPPRIADGVKLHRMIDQFTDQHPTVRSGVDRLRATQGRYAPVVIDVIYDHILASSWSEHHSESLEAFAKESYQRLENHHEHFPERVKQFFPYMKAQNWLVNYQFEWGMQKSLEGLDRRASAQTEMFRSVEVFNRSEREFRAEFKYFIADIQEELRVYFRD